MAEVSRLRDSLGQAEAARGAAEREAVLQSRQLEAATAAEEEARAKLRSVESALRLANESAALERENARNANLLLRATRDKDQAVGLESQVGCLQKPSNLIYYHR